MLLNVIMLGCVFVVGHRSWRQQKKVYDQRILAQQRQTTQDQKSKEVGKPIKSISRTSNKRRTPGDWVSISVAVLLSSSGYLLIPPFAYLSVPFLLYAARKHFIIAWYLLKQGRIDIETLSAASIIGTVIGQRFFLGSLLGFFIITGEQIASRIIHDSRHQLMDVFQDMPKTVWLLQDDVEILAPIVNGQGWRDSHRERWRCGSS
ncbi:MAG TPA: hypothetical protein EYP59_08215 [Thiotrichaceae bacterium]|nr:hypothetical protein [Thiotrichaceae bacterium]